MRRYRPQIAVTLIALLGAAISLAAAASFPPQGSGGGVTTGGDYTLGTVLFEDGTQPAPSISFASDPSVGFYRVGTDQIGLTVAGTQPVVEYGNGGTSWDIDWTAPNGNAAGQARISNTLGAVFRFGAGSASSPAVSFIGDPDTGLYSSGANQISFAAGGGQVFAFNGSSTGFTFLGNRLSLYKLRNSDVTGDATLGAESANSGFVYTNIGATGTVTLTLRSAPAEGYVATFKRVASFAYRIRPNTNDAIVYSGGTMADNEYLELASDGAFITIVADSNGNWCTVAEGGTLTEETP